MARRMGRGIELLADDTRRRLIAMLALKPQRPSTLARALGLTPQTVSHHLRLLREAGLVRILNVFTDGRVSLYAINPREHGRITAWLAGTDLAVPEDRRRNDLLDP